MKHEMRIEPKPTWRLNKTLRRRVDFREMEPDDIKFLWAAYRMGSLATLGERFAVSGMGPEEFKAAVEHELTENYDAQWTLIANTKRGFMPVGIVLGFHSHSEVRFSPFMILGDIVWFPWASRRNQVEAAVNFFNRIRRELNLVEYADETARPFFEMICKHGIMRRIGTSFCVYPGQPTAMFETRRSEAA